MTWAPATIAVVLIGYATVSRRLERLNVSGAMFFTTAGLLVGPVLGLLDFEVESGLVKRLAEVTLTLVLFADAARISLPALRHEYAVPLRLLGIGLPLTILAGAVAGAVVVPGVSFAEALVLAVVLACTDAALGQAVVSDERIPSRIRQGLNVESGLNDGLCVPLFFIAIALAEADSGTVSDHTAAELVLEEIGYSIEVEGSGDMSAKGNVLDHEYEIERDGDKVVEVSKRWLRVRDSYGIEVASGQD